MTSYQYRKSHCEDKTILQPSYLQNVISLPHYVVTSITTTLWNARKCKNIFISCQMKVIVSNFGCYINPLIPCDSWWWGAKWPVKLIYYHSLDPLLIHWFHFRAITFHHKDVIMGRIASQITSLTIVYSGVYLGADQRKHHSSESLAFVQGIHRGPVNSLHKWPVMWKMFPFDDVIMSTVVWLTDSWKKFGMKIYILLKFFKYILKKNT